MTTKPEVTRGRFEIEGEIGAGGMAAVYLGHELALNRKVAIKVLPAEVADSPERRKRFEREARAAAALNHPNIITVYEVGEHDGRPYIAMAYIDGEDLASLLRRIGKALDFIASNGEQ